MPTDNDDFDEELYGDFDEYGRRCPNCEALLVHEAVMGPEHLTVESRCPTHGLVEVADPFNLPGSVPEPMPMPDLDFDLEPLQYLDDEVPLPLALVTEADAQPAAPLPHILELQRRFSSQIPSCPTCQATLQHDDGIPPRWVCGSCNTTFLTAPR